MKKILVVMSLFLISCESSNYNYKYKKCDEILKQRIITSEEYTRKDLKEQISKLDTLFIRCGCDTIQ